MLYVPRADNNIYVFFFIWASNYILSHSFPIVCIQRWKLISCIFKFFHSSIKGKFLTLRCLRDMIKRSSSLTLSSLSRSLFLPLSPSLFSLSFFFPFTFCLCFYEVYNFLNICCFALYPKVWRKDMTVLLSDFVGVVLKLRFHTILTSD